MLTAGSRLLTKQSTAPVLLADYVNTGNGLKMASTAAYNLWITTALRSRTLTST